MTKYRPILFSTPMVSAIIEGRKTMTRRIKGLENINENPNQYRYNGILIDKDDYYNGCHFFEYLDTLGNALDIYHPVDPVMNIDDVFWVRESFFAEGYWEPCGTTKTGKQKYRFFDDTKWSHLMPNHGYKYQENPPKTILKFPNTQRGYYKRNSLFMPKEACRIFLRLKSIKAEKILDICNEDAIAEGIEVLDLGYKNYDNHVLLTDFDNAQSSFFSLWSKINGQKSLQKNPFVWVYEFERIDKPLDF